MRGGMKLGCPWSIQHGSQENASGSQLTPVLGAPGGKASSHPEQCGSTGLCRPLVYLTSFPILLPCAFTHSEV